MLDTNESFRELPALTPPRNTTPNFTNPPNLMPWIIGVAACTMVLMLIAMIARTYTKLILMKEWRHEDYWATFALVGVFTWDILFVYTAHLGLSRHQWDIRMVDMPRLLELTNICEIIYGPTMFAAKFAVLLQLKRIFCAARQRDMVWWTIMFLMLVVTGYYSACFFMFIFQCWPRAKIRDPTLRGHCIDPLAATLAAGIINFITDVGILVAPMFAIWRLQMPVKRKVGVASVFGVGLFACITGLLGVIWRLPLITSPDFTWIIAKVGLWAMAEYFAIKLSAVCHRCHYLLERSAGEEKRKCIIMTYLAVKLHLAPRRPRRSMHLDLARSKRPNLQRMKLLKTSIPFVEALRMSK